MARRLEQAKTREAAARRGSDEVFKLSVKYLQSPSDATLLELQERTTAVLDKLREILDFCATELYERSHGQSAASAGVEVHFPIASRGTQQRVFAGIVRRTIPGLLNARPDLFHLLESFQEFSSPANRWLPDLVTLAMQNRNDPFAHRERIEHGGIYLTNATLTDEGRAAPRMRSESLIIGAKGKMIIHAGTTFRADQITIRGPRTIRGCPPFLDPPGEEEAKVKACAFAAIQFKATGEMVQSFLASAFLGLSNIIQQLESHR